MFHKLSNFFSHPPKNKEKKEAILSVNKFKISTEEHKYPEYLLIIEKMDESKELQPGNENRVSFKITLRNNMYKLGLDDKFFIDKRIEIVKPTVSHCISFQQKWSCWDYYTIQKHADSRLDYPENTISDSQLAFIPTMLPGRSAVVFILAYRHVNIKSKPNGKLGFIGKKSITRYFDLLIFDTFLQRMKRFNLGYNKHSYKYNGRRVLEKRYSEKGKIINYNLLPINNESNKLAIIKEYHGKIVSKETALADVFIFDTSGHILFAINKQRIPERIAISPCRQHIALLHIDGQVKIIKVIAGEPKVIKQYNIALDFSIPHLTFAPDITLFICYLQNEHVIVKLNFNSTNLISSRFNLDDDMPFGECHFNSEGTLVISSFDENGEKRHYQFSNVDAFVNEKVLTTITKNFDTVKQIPIPLHKIISEYVGKDLLFFSSKTRSDETIQTVAEWKDSLKSRLP